MLKIGEGGGGGTDPVPCCYAENWEGWWVDGDRVPCSYAEKLAGRGGGGGSSRMYLCWWGGGGGRSPHIAMLRICWWGRWCGHVAVFENLDKGLCPRLVREWRCCLGGQVQSKVWEEAAVCWRGCALFQVPTASSGRWRPSQRASRTTKVQCTSLRGSATTKTHATSTSPCSLKGILKWSID